MSAQPLLHRNHEGVLLRYDPHAVVRHHIEQQGERQPSDRLRIAVLKAERQIKTLWTIAEHLEVSEIGMTRIAFALRTVDAALKLSRDELGMYGSVALALSGNRKAQHGNR